MARLISRIFIPAISLLLITAPKIALGFVLLSGPSEARLPATPEAPTIPFIYENNSPKIDEKEKFMDGQYTSMSDQELFPIIIQIAMDRWNAVTGSYLRLKLEEGGNPDFNSDDKLYSIVFGTANLSTAALAFPTIEGDQITDCDIKVSNRATTAMDLSYTVLHELGHCIGLGHYHTNYESVMGYSHLSRALHLGADDRAGIIYLYPDPNISDDKAKELISCGFFGGGQNGPKGNFTIALILALPLIIRAFKFF